jgi:hypothetical protein
MTWWLPSSSRRWRTSDSQSQGTSTNIGGSWSDTTRGSVSGTTPFPIVAHLSSDAATHELMPSDLRSAFVKHEPPSVTKHGRHTNIDSDDHVSEEQPRSDKGFPSVSGRRLHDHVVGRVETERGGRKTAKQTGGFHCQHCETTFQQTRSDAHSVTKLTQSNCTGIKASGMPNKTVKKIETTSPIFDEIKYRINCFVLL